MYLMFVNVVKTHEVILGRNYFTGHTFIDSVTGIKLNAPWVFVNNIDTRPHRVCVTSASRNFNCKLVSFDKSGWEEFIDLEGFYYFWWANRISFNMGHDQEYRGINNLLRGYSFDETPRNFIKIHKESGFKQK